MRLRFVSGSMLVLAALAASTGMAEAYIGPGAGLSAIGSVISVVSAMFLAIAGFVWYPIKRLLKRGKAKASDEKQGPSSPA